MSLQMRWTGETERDRVATTRQRCYGPAAKEMARYTDSVHDPRVVDGDYLLAEQDGMLVGTATSLSLSMWMRGGRIPCQGVAWVGTLKTHRRKAAGPGRGIASQIMEECLRLAREREQAVSALMPFRASFYDHFGYGVVERLCHWTVPVSVLPSGDFSAVRYFEPTDANALAACRQRHVERGQCDIERSPAGWAVYLKKWADGWLVIDREGDGPVRGYLAFTHLHKDGKDFLNVTEAGFDDGAALLRLLHFIASLRDQYLAAMFVLPADLPLNRVLRETQLPHRAVNHPFAEMRTVSRMSIRVLDHRRVIESLRFPQLAAGRVVVAVHEIEGKQSRFAVDMSDGRATAAPSEASADFECPDRIWAAIVSGDLPASKAVLLGLAQTSAPTAAEPLDVLAAGPVPFCQEYF